MDVLETSIHATIQFAHSFIVQENRELSSIIFIESENFLCEKVGFFSSSKRPMFPESQRIQLPCCVR